MIPEIPGEKAPPEILPLLQREVAEMLGRSRPTFPGAQPVSFARKHLNELRQRHYFLCEKTDGIRCLLYCSIDSNDQEVHYLIDRKNDFYYVHGLHFPKKDDQSFMSFHDRTLLDGELVVDTIRSSNGSTRHQLRYLAFDCIMLDGELVVDRVLDKRLGKMIDFFYKPHKQWASMYPEAAAAAPFEFKTKQMEFSYAISKLFEETLPNLAHGNDGLIFTCKDTPYVYGTDEHIIKWKPPHENTIDFKLDLVQDSFPLFDPGDGGDPIPDYYEMPRFRLLVNYGDGEHRPFQHDLYLTREDWENMMRLEQVLDERIIECYRTPDGRWRYKREDDGAPRFRDDKREANHISTVRKVLESIEDAVTEEDLRAAEMGIRAAWKERDAARNDAKRKAEHELRANEAKRRKESE